MHQIRAESIGRAAQPDARKVNNVAFDHAF
jgi:hypothetical protein